MIKKRVVAWMILIVILCKFDSGDVYGVEKEDSSEILKQLIEKEENSNKIQCVSKKYRKSIEYWNEINYKLKEDKTFTDKYAGAYIDDNDELVVMLTGKIDEEVQRGLLKKVKNIKYVEHTYKELEKINNVINNEMEKYNFINSVGINEKDNIVEIGLSEISDEYIKEIQKYVVNRSCIRFLKESEISSESSKLRGGKRVYYKDEYGQLAYGSIGFRARSKSVFGTINGFVTAGHVGYKVGLKIYADAKQERQIGKVHITKQKGKIDAAFVEVTNSNYVLSRQVKYKNDKGDTVGVTLNCTPNSPIEGQIVYKSGSTTYLTSGKVKKKSMSINIDGIKYNDVAKADYKSDGGDSGGIIYEPFYAMKNPYCPIGIHAASGGIFIKIQNILDDFKLELY